MTPLELVHDKPLVWAHRGGRSLAAENTMKALRMAHEVGAEGWETDVQLTRDGEVIILHDLSLMRSTNAACHPAFVGKEPLVPWRFTLEEIKMLSADVFPRRLCPVKTERRPWKECPDVVAPDVTVPTLREALRKTREYGMWVNVEIKDIAKAVPAALANEIVTKVLAVIAEEGMDDQVIISSFNHDYVKMSKAEAPHILTGALTPHKFAGDPVKMLRETRVDAWHPGFRLLTEKAIKDVRAAGFAINPYTINELADMKRLTEWGITGIVTDRPQDAREWLG